MTAQTLSPEIETNIQVDIRLTKVDGLGSAYLQTQGGAKVASGFKT